MADKKRANTVKLVGYLKENNLEQITNARGDKVIRGSLIIATDKISSHKVQFYVSETTSAGEPSKDYAQLLAILPTCTITIASFLKENPSADFDTAANAASKVWVIARFEEYATRSGERVKSSVTIKGIRAGFSKPDKVFDPSAEFEVDVYVYNLNEETDESGASTGRVLIDGLVPKYNGSVDLIDFVAAPEDNGAADFVRSHYAVGDTVHLEGNIVGLQEKVAMESDSFESFGSCAEPQYTTRFIRERRICGGSKFKDGDDGVIQSGSIKEGLANREIQMEKNGAKAKSSPRTASTSAYTPAPKKSSSDDLDF